MSYTYKVWNDGTVCSCWCFLSIHKGERVIVEAEFIQGPVMFRTTNQIIKIRLKNGEKIAKERIKILEDLER